MASVRIIKIDSLGRQPQRSYNISLAVQYQQKMVGQIIKGTTCRSDKQNVTCMHQLPRTESCPWGGASAARLPWLRLGATIIVLKGPGSKLCSKGLHVMLGQQVIILEAAPGHSAACHLPARGRQALLKRMCHPRG